MRAFVNNIATSVYKLPSFDRDQVRLSAPTVPPFGRSVQRFHSPNCVPADAPGTFELVRLTANTLGCCSSDTEATRLLSVAAAADQYLTELQHASRVLLDVEKSDRPLTPLHNSGFFVDLTAPYQDNSWQRQATYLAAFLAHPEVANTAQNRAVHEDAFALIQQRTHAAWSAYRSVLARFDARRVWSRTLVGGADEWALCLLAPARGSYARLSVDTNIQMTEQDIMAGEVITAVALLLRTPEGALPTPDSAAGRAIVIPRGLADAFGANRFSAWMPVPDDFDRSLLDLIEETFDPVNTTSESLPALVAATAALTA